MRFVVVLVASLGISTAGVATDRSQSNKAPSKMSPKQIAEYNQGLDSNDPGYIRCRRIEATGSLVGKVRVCKSNDQWRSMAESQNQQIRDDVESMARSGGSNAN